MKDDSIQSVANPECYLCKCPGEFIHLDLEDRLFGASGKWNLKKCVNPDCGFIWLDPMPLEEEIFKAYKNYYTHDSNASKDTLLGIFRLFYRSCKRLSTRLIGSTSISSKVDSMYLDQIIPGKLLDVGCGSGKFLSHMQKLGWDVEGIDFDDEAINEAISKYNVKARVGNLSSINYPDECFDAITMNHVIEHVSDPIALLKECNPLLRIGGYLVIYTPNINSWGHSRFKNNWRGLEPPRHLQLFSQNTLRECAKQAGFREIKTSTNASRSRTILHESIKLNTKKRSSSLQNAMMLLKSIVLYVYECLISGENSDLGEELILIARKE